eukprot:PhM_4_TR839/c0_g1_i1/m.59543
MSNNDSCIMCISANYLWCSIQHVCVVPSGSSPIGPSAECTDACTQTSSESCLGHESLKYCALTSTCTWGNDTTVACDRWTFPTPAPHHHTDPGGSTHHPGLGVILGACGGIAAIILLLAVCFCALRRVQREVEERRRHSQLTVTTNPTTNTGGGSSMTQPHDEPSWPTHRSSLLSRPSLGLGASAPDVVVTTPVGERTPLMSCADVKK